jgi:hypothetical protein
MMDKIFGIMRRAYYLTALLITLLGIFWLSTESYSYYKQPVLTKWKLTGPVPNNDLPAYIKNLSNPMDIESVRKNPVQIELTSKTEIVTVEVDSKFLTMTKDEQNKDVLEISEVIWPKKHYSWVNGLLTILLTLPIAIMLHRIAHWVIWGKLK